MQALKKILQQNQKVLLSIFTFFIAGAFPGQNEFQVNAERNFKLLNYRSQLNDFVSIDADGVRIFSSPTQKKTGTPEFTLFWEEVPAFTQLTKTTDSDSLINWYEKKKNNNYSSTWVVNGTEISLLEEVKILPLEGKVIALDPGHIAGDMVCAKIEQKYLDWRANDTTGLKEPVQIAEGVLTWQTAMLIKYQLEKQGARVIITRSTINSTSFGLSYDEWLEKRKIVVLDSLKKIKKISATEHQNLLKADKKKFFWDFFRDYDLSNRVKIINAAQADLSLIIHYNVDEKNTDWKKPSDKNFSMCFIGGAMTSDNFNKTINKIQFLRLLVTDDMAKSEKLSAILVKQFVSTLKTDVAGLRDATYLTENCVATNSSGVFSRNLALCRGINTPLAYGESLYQDHREECLRLNKSDQIFFEIKTNERVKQVADCYVGAVLKYFNP